MKHSTLLTLLLAVGMCGCGKKEPLPPASEILVKAKTSTADIDWIAKLKDKALHQHFRFEIKCVSYGGGFYGKAASGPLKFANNGMYPKELGGIPYWFAIGNTQQITAQALFYEVDSAPEEPDTLEHQAQEAKQRKEHELHCPAPITGGDSL